LYIFTAAFTFSLTDFAVYPLLKAADVAKVLPDARVTEYLARVEAAVPTAVEEVAGMVGYIGSKL
jgi:methylaspartate ammonia-lyase